MKAGLYELYRRLKEKGKLKDEVSWEQFYRSKCFVSKAKLSNYRIKQNETTIFNRTN